MSSEPLPMTRSRGMSLLYLQHKRGEAVRSHVGRQTKNVACDCRARRGDDRVILFRLERARCVDDRLTRDGERAGEKFALQFRERREILFAQSPFDLRIFANRSGRAARRVEQYRLKFAFERRTTSV